MVSHQMFEGLEWLTSLAAKISVSSAPPSLVHRLLIQQIKFYILIMIV